MKKKMNIKIFIMLFLFIFTILYPYETINAKQMTPNTSSEISSVTRTNNLVWKYKIINGKLYRRLYDQTQDKWIGDWELVS